MKETLKYTILDPTGNITALVECPVDLSRQPYAASLIMQKHTEVEQVGFVQFCTGNTDVSLRMAGGEFCGNASMCAAALYHIRTKDSKEKVLLRVSGAGHPVEVTLSPEEAGRFEAEILMPPALSIDHPELTFGALSGKAAVVKMEGISHIIIPMDSPFFCLLSEREMAEKAVRSWCDQLACDGLGLMFLDEQERLLTPLVYIPGSSTVFWENSCASGTTAAGIYLAETNNRPVDIRFLEPGGTLNVSSDPSSRRTHLRGSVSLVETAAIDL